MRALRIVDRANVKAQFQWEPRNAWVGLFWRRTNVTLHLYVCVVPFVPLHITILRRPRDNIDERLGCPVLNVKCRKCEGGRVRVKTIESSCGAYDDDRYTCEDCGHFWWVDGADS